MCKVYGPSQQRWLSVNPQKMPLRRKGNKSMKLARAHKLMHLFYTPTNSAAIHTSMAAPLLPFTVIWSQGAHHIHLCHALTAMLNSLGAHTQTRTNKQYKFICITFSALSTIAIDADTPGTRVECTRIQTRLPGQTVFCILQISVSTTLNYCWSSKGTLSVSVCVCVCVCLYCRLNVLHDRWSPQFGFCTRYLHRHLLHLPYPVYLILILYLFIIFKFPEFLGSSAIHITGLLLHVDHKKMHPNARIWNLTGFASVISSQDAVKFRRSLIIITEWHLKQTHIQVNPILRND